MTGIRRPASYPARMTSVPVDAPARRRRRFGLCAVAVAAAGLGATTHPFDRTATLLVVVCTLAALARAVRGPDRRVRADSRIYRGLGLWLGLAIALLTWEMFAWSRQPSWSVPDPAHPTLSTLIGPYLDHGPLRFAGWLAWLGLGGMLVRR
jgi:hypothetical protein